MATIDNSQFLVTVLPVSNEWVQASSILPERFISTPDSQPTAPAGVKSNDVPIFVHEAPSDLVDFG